VKAIFEECGVKEAFHQYEEEVVACLRSLIASVRASLLRSLLFSSLPLSLFFPLLSCFLFSFPFSPAFSFLLFHPAALAHRIGTGRALRCFLFYLLMLPLLFFFALGHPIAPREENQPSSAASFFCMSFSSSSTTLTLTLTNRRKEQLAPPLLFGARVAGS
jgi:hypothetical protein